MTDPRAPDTALDQVPAELWHRRNAHRLRHWLDRHGVRPSLLQVEQRRAAAAATDDATGFLTTTPHLTPSAGLSRSGRFPHSGGA